MPFIARDQSTNITGLYALAQPGYAEEFLPEDHADVVAFRNRVPIEETVRDGIVRGLRSDPVARAMAMEIKERRAFTDVQLLNYLEQKAAEVI